MSSKGSQNSNGQASDRRRTTQFAGLSEFQKNGKNGTVSRKIAS